MYHLIGDDGCILPAPSIKDIEKWTQQEMNARLGYRTQTDIQHMDTKAPQGVNRNETEFPRYRSKSN